MRMVQIIDGRVRRPGDGKESELHDQHFVDEAGSAAIVGGRLYIDGRPAGPGVHALGKAGRIRVEVDARGKARRTPGGGKQA